MGLDSYFRINGKPLADQRLNGLNLCGGMLSGDGADGSFRGKVYDAFLSDITNNEFSLYREEQGVAEYGRVPAMVNAWLETHPGDHDYCKRGEAEDLKTLFEVAAEQNATLIGWW